MKYTWCKSQMMSNQQRVIALLVHAKGVMEVGCMVEKDPFVQTMYMHRLLQAAYIPMNGS